MIHPHRKVAARGFSLIEIMVAVVVICVGLLGVAKMQALALSNTTNARLRSLASFEAASLAAAMHANRAYWASGSAAALTTVTSNPLAIATSDGNMGGAATTDLGTAPNITACVGTNSATAACSNLNGAALAGFDVARWTYNLGQLLPSPLATITCNPLTAPTECWIQIQWNEKAVVNNNNQTNVSNLAVQNSNNPSYTLYVEP